MEWKELTLENEDYVYSLEDNGIPVLFAQDYGDDGIGYFDDRWMSVHTMAKSGGFYFYELPRLEIKKV